MARAFEGLEITDPVEVVEHEDKRPLTLGQRIGHPRNDDGPDIRSRCHQRREDAVVEWLGAIESGGDRPDQHRRFVVALVEGQPDEVTRVRLLPLRE